MKALVKNGEKTTNGTSEENDALKEKCYDEILGDIWPINRCFSF